VLRLHRTPAWAALLAAALAAPGASAIPITPGDFGSGAVTESFEGVTVGPNVSSPLAGVLEPGVNGPFTFASGVTFASTPNPGIFADGAFIHDFVLDPGAPSNDWVGNGAVDSALAVPFGGAYMGVFDSPSPPTNPVPIAFTFGQDMDRVGAWVAGRSATSITLSVYDGVNTLLDSITVAAGTVVDWDQDDHFLGLEASGIRRAVFSGEDFGLDALTFEEPSASVPEPGTAALVGVGLLVLVALSRRLRPDPSR
jgi:hypothetical protein